MSDRQELQAAVAAVLPPPIYQRTYDATVVLQHADGTVDLRVDDEQIREARRVPLRVGLPGARVVLNLAGQQPVRVRLAFEGGRPEGRYAFTFDQTLEAARGIARLRDQVDGGTLTIGSLPPPAPPGTGLLITYTPAGELVPTVIATLTGTLAIAPDPTVIALAGLITTASQETKLR